MPLIDILDPGIYSDIKITKPISRGENPSNGLIPTVLNLGNTKTDVKDFVIGQMLGFWNLKQFLSFREKLKNIYL